MKGFLCALIAAYALCLTCQATAATNSCVVAKKSLTGELENRIYQLPYDGGVQYLTIVGAEHDPKFVALKQAFSEKGELTGIRDAMHFNVLPEGSAMFQSRYAQDYPALPAVRLQSPDGEVVYQACGDEIPAIDNLYSELQARCDANCFRRQPQPHPAPAPNVVPQPPVVRPAVRTHFLTTWQRGIVIAGAVLIGFALGVARVVAPEWAA